jgi:hypothetical protein
VSHECGGAGAQVAVAGGAAGPGELSFFPTRAAGAAAGALAGA